MDYPMEGAQEAGRTWNSGHPQPFRRRFVSRAFVQEEPKAAHHFRPPSLSFA